MPQILQTVHVVGVRLSRCLARLHHAWLVQGGYALHGSWGTQGSQALQTRPADLVSNLPQWHRLDQDY